MPLNSEMLNCSSSLELSIFLLLSACKHRKDGSTFIFNLKDKALHLIFLELFLVLFFPQVNSLWPLLNADTAVPRATFLMPNYLICTSFHIHVDYNYFYSKSTSTNTTESPEQPL